MSSRWTFCALLALMPILPIRAADPPAPEVTVIKLSVEAKAAPKPALKYLLLPELRDMKPGNAIHGYLIAFMEQNNLYYNKEHFASREKWLACPLSELPNDLADYGGGSSKQADYAARLDICDWQILLKAKDLGIMLLLPEVQQLRALAGVLKVRYRGQIKAGKFDDAIKTHQTMFALARHLGEHPTLIGDLVGIAIAAIAIGPFEEMIQQPGAPNLYWAIGQLPTPFIDLRKGMQGERLLVDAEFKDFIDPARVWDEDQLRKAYESSKRYIDLFDLKDATAKKVQAWVMARLKDEKWLTETRTWLVSMGLPETQVKKYPPEQVMFRNLLAKYEIARDDWMKWVYFPFWQAEIPLFNSVKTSKELTEEEHLTTAVIAAFHKVRKAQARTDQRIAMLQIVEALRLHASDHDGKLPANLEEIKLPLPVDPVNGKAFKYKLEGATGILVSTPPKGEEKSAAYNIRYDVTVRK